MREITKPVKQYGKTWIIQLTADDRAVLGIENVGDFVTLKKVDENKKQQDTDESEEQLNHIEEDVKSYS